MTKLYTLLFACTLLLFQSCRTAGKAYQKGDYIDALQLGIKKLQKEPNDYELRDVVKKSYTYLVNEHEDNIRILSNSKSENRFERIYSEYQQLQRLYTIVRANATASDLVKPRDYSDYVETYRDQAMARHIELANQYMSEGTKVSYREAYRSLNEALRYRPDDTRLRRRRDSAYDMATTKVVITDLQQGGVYGYANTYEIQNFQRDVMRALENNLSNEFVRFYTEREARQKENFEPDQVMELNLSRIAIGQPYDERTTREVTKEVVIKEIVHKPDSITRQMGTVKARITNTRRTLLSQGDLFITVRDRSGRVIWNDRFTGEHRWQTEFATYTGDERALSESDKTLLNRPQEVAPTEDRILAALLDQVRNDLSQRLRSYYHRTL